MDDLLQGYFLVKSGEHYIVAQSIVAVHEKGLAPAVADEFHRATAGKQVLACDLSSLPTYGGDQILKFAFSVPGRVGGP